MARIGFVGPSYASQSVIADCQMTMNWFTETMENSNSKAASALYPTPGLSSFAAISGSSNRGAISVNSRAFVVIDTKFYEIKSDGTSTSLGTVTADTGPASLASSGTQIMIVSGGNGFYFDLTTNTFGTIAGLLEPVSQCGFDDAYFIALLANSKQFQISALLDVTTWDAADTAIISVFSDNIVSMQVNFREIWFLGKKQSQVYADTGAALFPFEPIPGAFLEEGSAATYATVRMDNSTFWLGASERGQGIAWRANGYTPQRVSNHAVEWAWSQYSTISDAEGFSYQDSGHTFWVINFPTANATWVLDASTQQWHQRGYWDVPTDSFDRHLARTHMFAFGKHLVGARNSGTVYQMASTIYDDGGNPIKRVRRAPHISTEQEWMFHASLQVDMETGLGLSTGQGSDPQATLRWSNDGSKTWSSYQSVSAGKVGAYSTRVIFRRLGRARDRVYEFAVSDPIPWRIVDAYLVASPGYGATETLATRIRKQT